MSASDDAELLELLPAELRRVRFFAGDLVNHRDGEHEHRGFVLWHRDGKVGAVLFTTNPKWTRGVPVHRRASEQERSVAGFAKVKTHSYLAWRMAPQEHFELLERGALSKEEAKQLRLEFRDLQRLWGR